MYQPGCWRVVRAWAAAARARVRSVVFIVVLFCLRWEYCVLAATVSTSASRQRLHVKQSGQDLQSCFAVWMVDCWIADTVGRMRM